MQRRCDVEHALLVREERPDDRRLRLLPQLEAEDAGEALVERDRSVVVLSDARLVVVLGVGGEDALARVAEELEREVDQVDVRDGAGVVAALRPAARPLLVVVPRG
jgi:hypothetical protein